MAAGQEGEHHAAAVLNLAVTVLQNLKDQHDWTDLKLVNDLGGPRSLIRGLPPKRIYIHPDDQIAALAQHASTGEQLFQAPQYEWVLPVHINEKWCLARFAAVFASLPSKDSHQKRIVLAILHADSTVVYYFMHEGIVKPRQN
ncbi:uncharacterized protein UV8b_06363 [Ustilaginoidea virens]|uniref:tRNA-splicing endonuclease subunit Sen15 domain-containing protein n=1 Tax=Ustilaginoidea virens TaxID=1159556 RepID=A0A8E5HVA1_USTVR|nr:uncharacterized protein UV8b_06363 [Ustilaginoidea virens]QUC22122.1 hypothetical protein UV8b_06363 [Ustilaginoidea virens]